MKFCGECGASLREAPARDTAQAALEELRRRFLALADTVPVLIWTAGPDAARTFFNKPWLDFTGRALEQEQGAGWLDGVHPDDRPACREAYLAAFESKRETRLEYRLRRADGRYRWILDTGVPRFGPDGAFGGFIGSCVDITERRQAEARFRSLIENASDIISVIRPDGVIQYESPSVERLLGWRPDELVGRQILDYVHPDDVAHVVASIARRIEDPTPVNPPTEFRVRARDGSWHVLAAMSRVSQDETGAMSLVVNSRDVTEERGLEEQLRQAQRLESIGQLAGGIAHDFNNLLTVILGRGALLRRRLSSDQSLRPHVELIEDTAKRGAMLTQQLLTFGRKQMLQPRDLDLNTVVAGILPLLERLIGEQVSIGARLDPGLGRIRGDRATIEQVIVNLVVTDVVMPGMNGRELAEQVLRLREETKVLYVSGYTDMALGPYGVLESDIALLPKPFTPSSLTARVAEALRGPRGAR